MRPTFHASRFMFHASRITEIMSQSFLRTALSNIHRDPTWWRSVLIGGACMLSIVGWPMAGGLVVENMENSTKGYPTPLPPWVDLGTRYIIGLFALMIDFVLFVLPLFFGGSILICAMVATLIGVGGGDRAADLFRMIAFGILIVVGLFELFIFLLGASPVARLTYVEDGRIEEAIGGRPVQQILRSPSRVVYVRARLASLPAYLPLVALALITWGVTMLSFPGQILVIIALIWLMLSALFYAHLAIGQIYVMADQEIQRAEMNAMMAQRM